MARIDTLPNFLTDVANAIRSKTGNSDLIQPEEYDTEIGSISGGGYDGQLPKNSYISAKGTSSDEVLITVTNTDTITDGTRVFYQQNTIPSVNSQNYIDIPASLPSGKIINLNADSKYGVRACSYVIYDTDKKALNTSNTMLTTGYALTLPEPGGVTNKFTIVAPQEVSENSYSWGLEYDAWDDILYLYSNGNLLYKMKSDFTWEQITLPNDASVERVCATKFGLYIGDTNGNTTNKLYRYKNNNFINCNIVACCTDIRILSCGIYLFLPYFTTPTGYPPTIGCYRYDEDNDTYIRIINTNINNNTKYTISDYGEDVYIRGSMYYSGNYSRLYYFNTTNKTCTTVSNPGGQSSSSRYSGANYVDAIGDDLYLTTYSSEYSSGRYIAIIENKTECNSYDGNRTYSLYYINPFNNDVILIIASNIQTPSSYILNKATKTVASDRNWQSSIYIFGSLIFDNCLFLYNRCYQENIYTEYSGTIVCLYDANGFVKQISPLGNASYRPHMWVDEDGNLYRLEQYLRRYDTSTKTFTQLSGYPDGSGAKSYKMVQIENRRYFSQANSTTGPLLYIKNGVCTKLGTGRYDYVFKYDNNNDLLVSSDPSVTQKLVNINNLTVTDTGVPGGSKFFNKYIVNNNTHIIYENTEVDETLSENYTFTPSTSSSSNQDIVNKSNTFDYMYYTSSSNYTALVYTEPYDTNNS